MRCFFNIKRIDSLLLLPFFWGPYTKRKRGKRENKELLEENQKKYIIEKGISKRPENSQRLVEEDQKYED
jgi:hypothetical protein